MIGLSDNQLEVIMRAAEPLPEEKCQEFLQKVTADLQVRGQINDDDSCRRRATGLARLDP